MLTKFNDSNDMNTVASEAIHSYIKDGYHIDAKESVIDREKDKDCTFKAVLKKDVDGIECKTVITLADNGDDKNKSCKYHKVETVGDTVWSEETRTFSSSTSAKPVKDTDTKTDSTNLFKKMADDNDDWLAAHRKRMKHISDMYGFGWNWFDDDCNKPFKRLDDVIKTSKDTVDDNLTDRLGSSWRDDKHVADAADKLKTEIDNFCKKDTKWKCKCPSAYQDVKSSDDEAKHIKVNADDSAKDIFNKIKTGSDLSYEDACDKLQYERMKSLKGKYTWADDYLSCHDENGKLIEPTKDNNSNDEDEEDSLIRLVRYIFGK